METKVLLKTNGFAQILFCWAIKRTVIYRHRGLVRWIGQNYFKEWFVNEAEYHFRVGFRKFWQDEDINLFQTFCNQKQKHFLIKVTQRTRKGLESVVSYICASLVDSGKKILLIAAKPEKFCNNLTNYYYSGGNGKLVCIKQNTSARYVTMNVDFDIIVVFGVTISSDLLFKYIIPVLSTPNKMFINFYLPGDASSVYDQLMQLDPPLFRIIEQ